MRDALTSSDSRFHAEPSIGFDRSGRGMAAWSWSTPSRDRDRGYGFAFRTPGGRWGQAFHVQSDDVVHAASAYGGAGNGVVVLGRADDVLDFETASGGATFRQVLPGGRVTGERPLDGEHKLRADDVTVAMNERGRALIAWTRADERDGGVYVRDVSPGGRVGPARRLELRGRSRARR